MPGGAEAGAFGRFDRGGQDEAGRVVSLIRTQKGAGGSEFTRRIRSRKPHPPAEGFQKLYGFAFQSAMRFSSSAMVLASTPELGAFPIWSAFSAAATASAFLPMPAITRAFV